MDRALLTKILTTMRVYLEKGNPIGDLKVASLLSIGSQLEAIFYYLGHELGSNLKVKNVKEISKIPEALKEVIREYHIGQIEILESSKEIIQLKMNGHSSIKDLINKEIKSEMSFCSFEAGLLAGIVENMSDIHCFSQELSCCLQSGKESCSFLIVFQKD